MRAAIWAVSATAALAGVAHADDGGLRSSLGIGTGGLEAGLSYGVSPTLELRGTLSVADVNVRDEVDDIRYRGGADWVAGGIFLDWRPFENWFTVIGGAQFGHRTLDLNATPNVNATIGGTVYTPAQIGRLQGRVELGELAPYLGMAADFRPADGTGLGFRLSAGVVYNDVNVSLRAVDGLLASDAAFQADVEREEAEVADELEGIELYPIITAAVTYSY